MIIKLPYRGRQTGKTTELAKKAVNAALSKPNMQIAFVGENYKETYRHVGPIIEQLLKQRSIAFQKNMFGSYFELYSGSSIGITDFYSHMDFRGCAYDYIFIDLLDLENVSNEVQESTNYIINNLIYPSVITKNGTVTVFNFKNNADIIKNRLGIK